MSAAPIKGDMVAISVGRYDGRSANGFSFPFKYSETNVADAKEFAVWPLGKLCMLFTEVSNMTELYLSVAYAFFTS